MTDEELNALSQEMFRTFARCEYALKAADFHNGEGKAEPSWRNFALSIEALFQNPPTADLAEAINYILARPPRKQMIRQGQLVWEAAEYTTNSRADLVLLHVRCIRNNLFHGGKFNGHWFEPERSGELLTHGLRILRAAVESSAPVREAFG